MELETIAKALAEASQRRLASGEKVYIAQMDDGRYVGKHCAMVKTRQSALRLFSSPDAESWQGVFPYHEYDHDHMDNEGKAELLARLTIIEVRPMVTRKEDS